MAVYPVIMCGGSGTRLWPSSSASRPKQFIALTGPHSLLQETALRVAPLVEGKGRVVIVAAAMQAELIQEQLAAVGVAGTLLLEPSPRDSAAAIAAAAAWIEGDDPEGVAVIVASDHEIPDAEGFRDAIRATLPAARDGAVVTLGVRPTEASTAYGYIRAAAGEAAVRPVSAFVEKPDAATASAYVADGYLWNSGNFVASAGTLISQMEQHAPDTLAAVRAGLASAAEKGGALFLGAGFQAAPKVAFDYAIMEKTDRAAVMPVDFSWSDLGAWDAVWAAAERDGEGSALSAGALAIESSNLLVRAPAGVTVAVVGLKDVAVVVEPNGVLVCAFKDSQKIKAVAEAARLRELEAERFATLQTAAAWFSSWLDTAALPVWGTLGADPQSGAFREALTLAGAPAEERRRVRSQTRQTYVYAAAAASGRTGPWLQIARRGHDFVAAHAMRPDGLVANVLGVDGQITDPSAKLYEQAFALLALSALYRAEGRPPALLERAAAIRDGLSAFRHARGGFRENGDQPFQANAQMHLFEVALEWAQITSDPVWAGLADELGALALSHFIDVEAGLLREYFREDWSAVTGSEGLLEPGHHFEWAWLMERWGRRRGKPEACAAARALFRRGVGGVDPRSGAAVNAVWDDFTIRDPEARLWPQTEYLKAALILGEEQDALRAATALRRYLEVPVRGLWRDRMRPDGRFADNPAPASSFYHIWVAVQELVDAAKA